MQKIEIQHIPKIEGHSSFHAHLRNGEVDKAYMDVTEGARLIEGLLIGRDYDEAPVVTSRICGICPVVHSLASIKGMEDALGVEPTKDTILLRKLIHLGEIIESHSMHLYFLALPDYLGHDHDVDLVKEDPEGAGEALRVREFGNSIIRVIAGRAIHPISTRISGFERLPSREALQELLREVPQRLYEAKEITERFLQVDFPKFKRKTQYFCIDTNSEYSFYTDDLIINEEDDEFETKEFYQNIREFLNKENDVVKRCLFDNKDYMLGAVARISNHPEMLNPEAKKMLKKSGLRFPTYNPFHNLIAQSIELIHSIEEIQKLLPKYLENKKDVLVQDYKIKAGKGLGVVEAPRGTLFHYYKIDEKGKICECNIISPTTQWLASLDADLKKYIGPLANRDKDKIRTLVRAYDPCISCATH